MTPRVTSTAISNVRSYFDCSIDAAREACLLTHRWLELRFALADSVPTCELNGLRALRRVSLIMVRHSRSDAVRAIRRAARIYSDGAHVTRCFTYVIDALTGDLS